MIAIASLLAGVLVGGTIVLLTFRAAQAQREDDDRDARYRELERQEVAACRARTEEAMRNLRAELGKHMN